ncbi:unnamed protein product [Cylindrotheca closterium]|uniref:Copper transport protein n=1 Tax=Cylindrotheca closterium TaxID=2856 RepID=A0AAD2G078_9STRA|nr:unnamed protein product [Cylindrotheca closterium]
MHDISGMSGMHDMHAMETVAEKVAVASNSFCEGDMGMVMYMDGFRWTLKEEGNSCLNLYFASWTLNSKGKVLGAMAAVFCLAVFTEAISKMRHKLSLRARDVSTPLPERRKIAIFQTLLHGIHAFIGYIVMLATMTFSLELLCCVIFGITTGYFVFGGESYSHVSTNPCCAFLEDEAQERTFTREYAAENARALMSSLPPEAGNCCSSELRTDTNSSQEFSSLSAPGAGDQA